MPRYRVALGLFVLLAALRLQAQTYQEISLPLPQLIRVATGSDGLVWVDDQPDTTGRGGQLLVFNPNGVQLNATPFDSAGTSRQVSGTYILIPGFYPQNNGGMFGHWEVGTNSEKYAFVQASTAGVKPVCDSFVIDAGQTPLPAFMKSGPFPAADGTFYVPADAPINQATGNSLLVLSGTNPQTATCNLSTVVASSRPIIQAWKLSATTFLAERVISAAPLNTVTEVALLGTDGTVKVLVGTDPSVKPQVLAAQCCTLAYDTVTKTGLVAFMTSDQKSHADICSQAGCKEVFNSDMDTDMAGPGLFALDIKGQWALIGGSGNVGWAESLNSAKLDLVNTVTGKVDQITSVWQPVSGITPNQFTFGQQAVAADGTVYFGFSEFKPVKGRNHLFMLPGPGVVPAMPVVTAFKADKAAITAGDQVNLTWATTGASVVTIDQGIGPVQNSGSVAVSPASTTTFTLSASNAAGSVTVTVTVNVVSLPTIAAVVDNTSGGKTIALGGIGAIYGANLATDTIAVSGGLPLPTTLATTQVLVGGIPAPLYYVSPVQVNFQLPQQAATGVNVPVSVVVSGVPSGTFSITIAAMAPALYAVGVDNATGQYTGTADNPLYSGEIVQFYGTGAGATQCNIATGQPAPSDQLCPLKAPSTLTIGGQTAEILFAGAAPGFVGLYQINAIVPDGSGTQTYPVDVVLQVAQFTATARTMQERQ